MNGEVELVARCSAARAHALVSDITRMGNWSPETVSAEWADAEHTTFRGTNEANGRRWTTTCRVLHNAAPHAFSFQVQRPGGRPGTTWTFAFEDLPDGQCRLVESFDSPGPRKLLTRLGTRYVLGIKDRAAHNLATMRLTLERLAAAAADGTR